MVRSAEKISYINKHMLWLSFDIVFYTTLSFNFYFIQLIHATVVLGNISKLNFIKYDFIILTSRYFLIGVLFHNK